MSAGLARIAVWVSALLLVALARADLQPEPQQTYTQLGEPSPHWLLYYDIDQGTAAKLILAKAVF